MTDRGQALLAAYRADTSPTSAHEDALFESIVRRIVTDESVEADDAADDAPDEVADVAPRRGRRAIVVPVAIATAAIAAGLVLALSMRGQIFTPSDDALPSQAPSTEHDAAPWWRRFVPGALLGDDSDLDVPQPAEPGAPLPAVEFGADATSPEGTPVGTEATLPPSGPASTATPAESLPMPTKSVQVPAGWSAPQVESPTSSEPRSTVPQVGGGLPSGSGGSPLPKDDDDSGKANRPRPGKSSGSGPGSGGSAGGDSSPPPPNAPPPANPPLPRPGSTPPTCETELDACMGTTSPEECELQYMLCTGTLGPCEFEFHVCMLSGDPTDVCDEQVNACFGQPPPAEDVCMDGYEMCAWSELDPAACLGEFSLCLDNKGGVSPQGCDGAVARCEMAGPPLVCDEVAAICFHAALASSDCDAMLMGCLESADPESTDMCDEAYVECVGEPLEGPVPTDDSCFVFFDACLADGQPEQCQTELITCVGA